MQSINEQPIAVIDSGLGGLTVVKMLAEKLPCENILYFGDNARVPYGDKSEENIKEFARQITRFLVNKKVKYIVVACNTMSSLALDEMAKLTDVPIVGVIDSTIEQLKDDGLERVGIIATSATVRSKVYENKIKTKSPNSNVYSEECPLFVSLIEEGFTEGHIVNEAIENYLAHLKDKKLQTLVLGCTHYTVFEKLIKEYFGSQNVKTINTSRPVIECVSRDLLKRGLQSDNNREGKIELYFSDSCQRYKKYFENLVIGENIVTIENVKID